MTSERGDRGTISARVSSMAYMNNHLQHPKNVKLVTILAQILPNWITHFAIWKINDNSGLTKTISLMKTCSKCWQNCSRSTHFLPIFSSQSQLFFQIQSFWVLPEGLWLVELQDKLLTKLKIVKIVKIRSQMWSLVRVKIAQIFWSFIAFLRAFQDQLAFKLGTKLDHQ